MELGLSAAAFYGLWETEEQALQLHRYPIDCCEVFLETHSEYSADFGRLVRRNLGGIPCRSVHPKGTQFEPDLFGFSPRQRADAMTAFTGVLDAAQSLGAKYYVMHGPGGPVSKPDIRRIHLLHEQLGEMRRRAAEHGIELLWENVSWAALRGPEEVRYCRSILPDMRFVLDIKQAFRGGERWQDILEAMSGRIAHVHLLDWDSAGRMALPGCGTVDFVEVFRSLRATGYDGACILEPYADQGRDPEALVRAIGHLRECMERA